MAEPINNIPEKPYIAIEPQHRYEVQVRDLESGEMIYLNESKAGVFCTMEKVTSFGAEIEGEHQAFAFGNPLLQWYCFDQMQKFIKVKLPEVLKEAEKRGFIKVVGNLDDLFKKDANI